MFNNFSEVNNSEPTISDMFEMPEVDFTLDTANFSWCCEARLDDAMPSHCPACGENQ
jgi:hypothetical protein